MRQAEERQQGVGGQSLLAAVEVADDDRREFRSIAVERMQLVGNHQVDGARRGQGFQATDAVGRRAELAAAVDDGDRCGDLDQRQRPVDGGVAAAGDDDPAAPVGLPAAHQVVHAFPLRPPLVGLDAGERRPIRPEGADAGGDNDGARPDGGVPRRAQPPAAVRQRRHRRHLLRQVEVRIEGSGLLAQPLDQVAGQDARIRGNVVYRLFRIQRRTLAAGDGESVDHVAAEAEHAALEHREQANGTGADDGDLGLMLRIRHGRSRGPAYDALVRRDH